MTKESTAAIEVKGLSKSFKLPHEQYNGVKQLLLNIFRKNKKRGYEIQHVLKNINFTVEKGEFFGIVGRNGSGKSTLLKLLSQIYTPDAGSVTVHGSLTPFIELGVGFNHELTGRENVFMNGALLGFSKSEMEEMYNDIVSFAELERFMDQKLKNYSSGMQVRLAFSIAIRANTDILILDEVLAVGDAAFQQKCTEYFKEIKNKKKTVILVTHDMESVKRFCDKALILSAGRIEAIGKPDEIADLYTKENIESINNQEVKHDTEISLKIDKVGKDGVNKELLFTIHHARYDKSIYAGISISHNGITIAEFNSKEVNFSENGTIRLNLDTSHLNPGAYEVGVAVFDTKNERPLDFNSKAGSFTINGNDPRRGGPLKIDGTWV